jgi:uncharacterized protein YaiI (UPF0178 family)
MSLVVVEAGPDAADDWIAQRAGSGDIVITADIPLADRVLKAGAQALHPSGRSFTSANIGSAFASRSIGDHRWAKAVHGRGSLALPPGTRRGRAARSARLTGR